MMWPALAVPLRLVLAVGLLLPLIACADNDATPEPEAPAREPVIQKGLGPDLTAEFETLYKGEPLPGGNSWELGGERGRETRFTVRMKVRSGGQVCRVTFHVSEFEAPSNGTVRELRDDPRIIGSGTYAYPLRWDGTDDDGALVSPGRYRLSAVLKTDLHDCERPMTTEGAGLGALLLGDTEGEPSYVPPVPA